MPFQDDIKKEILSLDENSEKRKRLVNTLVNLRLQVQEIKVCVYSLHSTLLFCRKARSWWTRAYALSAVTTSSNRIAAVEIPTVNVTWR